VLDRTGTLEAGKMADVVLWNGNPVQRVRADAEQVAEVGDVVETLDAQLGRENRISAAFNVLDGINPNSMLIPITRVAGITTAVSRPLGGLISGQAVVLDLAGSTVEDMVIRSPVAMFASLAHSAREAGMGARGGITLRLREGARGGARFWARSGGVSRVRCGARVRRDPTGPRCPSAGAERRDPPGG
jgi:hypothetical protein